MDMDLILTLDALLRDQNITHAAARLGISQPAMSARLARLRVLFGEPLFVPSPHGRGVLPTPRAEALRPQVATVLQGISAMLEPSTFNAQDSNRTFVIALHENPALMLGLSYRIRLAVRHRAYACVLHSRKPSCCQHRWKMAMWIFMSALMRGARCMDQTQAV